LFAAWGCTNLKEIDMIKLEISIAEYDWMDDEKVVIETIDFDKAQIIHEFIEFQKDFGWAADYQLSDEFIDAQCDEEDFDDEDEDVEYEDETDEDEEYEEYEIGEIVEDEDGLIWQRVA
jgi:hypothetical protein